MDPVKLAQLAITGVQLATQMIALAQNAKAALAQTNEAELKSQLDNELNAAYAAIDGAIIKAEAAAKAG